MSRLTWLPDVLRGAGLRVIEYPDWETRGSTRIEPRAVVCHHTASSPKASNDAVARLLANGRTGLKGPLSQLGLDRDGRFWLIASGRANHNGYGAFGNDSIGIEAFNDGKGEAWPSAQVTAYVRGCAAILRHLDLPVDRCLGHRETDPNRKIDPAGIDMDWFRRQVAALIDPQEDDDMAMSPAERKAFIDDIAGEVHKRVVLSLIDEDTKDDKAEVGRRDTIASLIRRVLGVPLMADGKEQHKADQDTGKRLQKLLGD